MSEMPWPPRSDDEYFAQAVEAVGADLVARLASVEVLIFDADGVLTPGNLVYGPRGEALKHFHARDGLGLVLARSAGLKRAVLTGRDSEIVGARAGELHFESIKLGRFDKLPALAEILDETGCAADRALYMGDDLIDLPAMYAVAVPVSVPEAPLSVREASCYVTEAGGGTGAVREIIDLVLKSSRRFGGALVDLAAGAWPPGREPAQ